MLLSLYAASCDKRAVLSAMCQRDIKLHNVAQDNFPPAWERRRLGGSITSQVSDPNGVGQLKLSKSEPVLDFYPE